MSISIFYTVPYEGGFSSGVDTFTDLTKAVEASRRGYGDVSMNMSISLYTNHIPNKDNIALVLELANILKEQE